MTIINIVFIALFVCAAVGLMAYRQGLGTGARVQRRRNSASHNAQAARISNGLRTIESLSKRLTAAHLRETQLDSQLVAMTKKQETHQAQLEAIMQDADTRIAIYARRANPFNQQDRITLQAAANHLDVAAIAQQYGGGGHRNAAGFKVPADHELVTGTDTGRPAAAFNAVIDYVLHAGQHDEPMGFLRSWNEGEFDTLRTYWPDAPLAIYYADSLADHAAIDAALAGQPGEQS